MIKQEFIESLKKCTTSDEQQMVMWNEVERNYARPDRHYHNLNHLNSMLNELTVHKGKFANWDAIIFAITYHDLVYNTFKSNNEQRSAEIMVKRLTNIQFPVEAITFCKALILATKKHEPGDPEINLFTDADLSILGADAHAYKEYAVQIRHEYSFYPDVLYNAGRKKVLMHFLKMPTIYKTKEFSDRYEVNAKRNVEAELNFLTNGHSNSAFH